MKRQTAPRQLGDGSSVWAEWLAVGQVVKVDGHGAMVQGRDGETLRVKGHYWVFTARWLDLDAAQAALAEHARLSETGGEIDSLWGRYLQVGTIAKVLWPALRSSPTIPPDEALIAAILDAGTALRSLGAGGDPA